MALREAYITQECSRLLGLSVKSTLQRAQRESWQFRPRKGRGGGKEWLVSSMPEATQRALQTAEERRAIEAEAALPAVAVSRLLSSARQAILDDKRRYKALAKADLLGLYLDWQAKHGSTIRQKQAFILAYQGGAWSKLLEELGPRVSWKSLEPFFLHEE